MNTNDYEETIKCINITITKDVETMKIIPYLLIIKFSTKLFLESFNQLANFGTMRSINQPMFYYYPIVKHNELIINHAQSITKYYIGIILY